MTDSNALLPNGMIDHMPEDAEREAAASQKLQSIFAQFGYRLVNPPMLEFEETLLAEGAGRALSTNTFRLMDPVSQRMMALRSDTTAQIARIAASRLKASARPLRLSYIADVLRIQPTQLRPERQFRQAGCEVIGGDLSGAATEIALMALIGLHKNGIKNISIDFTAPEILKVLSDKASNKEEIIRACYRRDRAAFNALGKIGKTLVTLDDLSGPAAEFFTKKKKATLPPDISRILDQLEKLIKDLEKALKIYGLDKNISITVDPLESRGFEYQSFPCFTLFAKNIRGELGRGGAYTSSFGDQSENACGFTLYMDSLLRAMPKSVSKKAVLAGEKTPWAEIVNLQTKGWSVIRCAGAPDIKKAKSLDATHIYKNGKVEDLK